MNKTMQTMTVYNILGECTGVIHWHPRQLRELLEKHGVKILLFPKGQTLGLEFDDSRIADWLEIPVVSVQKINDLDSQVVHSACYKGTAYEVAQTVRSMLPQNHR